MKTQPVRNFFFHPLLDQYSTKKKVAASLTWVALTILSGFTYQLVFWSVWLYDRRVKQKKEKAKPSQTFQKTFPPKGPVKTSPDKQRIEEVKKEGGTMSEWQSVGKDEFQGIDWLKHCHKAQTEIFETWVNAGQWDRIRDAHYDWWAFPLEDRAAGTGNRYTITDKEVDILQQDLEFMKEYRRGVELVMASWGWDVNNNKPHSNRQAYDNWDVRLKKISQSLHFFGGEEQKKLNDSLKEFAKTHTISQIAHDQIHKPFPISRNRDNPL